MNAVGIIAEYNPFHNGHAWQIQQAKKRAQAEYVVVAMSGDFVQRGAPAMTDKFTRARMALVGGADLVLELPVQYACAGAEYFARGAVALLHRTGVVHTVCFGCEDELPGQFHALADLLSEEPNRFKTHLRRLLTLGFPFPKARLEALLAFLLESKASPDFAAACRRLLSSPNNTLGLEYMLACKRDGYPMEFLPIGRTDNGYHSKDANGVFASASAIRDKLETASRYIPPKSFPYLKETLDVSGVRTPDDYSELLHYALLQNQNYANFLDVNSDLANRIANLLPSYQSFEQFISLLKTKQFTQTHIRRCLLHILLDIPQAVFDEERLPGLSYMRVLGFRKSAEPLLREIKQSSQAALITSPAQSRELLSASELAWFQMNLRASAIYHIPDGASYDEYRQRVIVV